LKIFSPFRIVDQLALALKFFKPEGRQLPTSYAYGGDCLLKTFLNTLLAELGAVKSKKCAMKFCFAKKQALSMKTHFQIYFSERMLFGGTIFRVNFL